MIAWYEANAMLKRLSTCAGALLALALAAPAPAAPAATELVQVSSGADTAFVATVRIGPLDALRFLVDTAATRTAITPRVRNLLGLHSTDAKTEVVTGAGGLIGTQSFILPSVAVGEAVEQDVHVIVLDLPHDRSWIGMPLDGILGMDFLRNYDVHFKVDAGSMELSRVSWRTGKPTELRDASRTAFDMGSPGLVVTSVKVNGQPVAGILDTGASRSVLNRSAAALAGIPAGGGEPVDTIGADGKPVRIELRKVDRLEVAGIAYQDVIVSVGDLPIFEQFDLDSVPAMILGAGCVKDREILISNSAHMLFIADKAGVPQGQIVVKPAPQQAAG